MKHPQVKSYDDLVRDFGLMEFKVDAGKVMMIGDWRDELFGVMHDGTEASRDDAIRASRLFVWQQELNEMQDNK